MAECCRTSMIDCELTILNGSTCTLRVQLHWTVATLKERIADEMHVPCYSQSASSSQLLSDSSRKLLNEDTLLDVYSAQDCVGTCLPLFLCLLEPPSQLGPTELQRAWEAFRMYSTDYGDTIPQSNLPGVLRYLHIPDVGKYVKAMMVDREEISFADVLSVMTAWKDASFKNEPKEFDEDDCYFFDMEDVCKRDEQHHDAPNVAGIIESIRTRQQRKNQEYVERCLLAQGASSCNPSGVATEEERSQSVRSTGGLTSSTLISL
eukprot:TRINITY_DN4868_c0_g2_i1.p1 TRINITY_DN4868_c0_g2~~TRINITY_DN4868_c0_g2_i1.p1  ORF type:complete len:280 (-),score=25.02 TRINITY_DN4868_c0_g2_i1:329-1117(-)